MDHTLDDTSDQESTANSSVFETPNFEEPARNTGSSMSDAPVLVIKSVTNDFSRSSLGSEGQRLDSEEFVDISVTAFEDIQLNADDPETNPESSHRKSAAVNEIRPSWQGRKLDDIAEVEELKLVDRSKTSQKQTNKTEVEKMRSLVDESGEHNLAAVDGDSGQKAVRFSAENRDVSHGDMHLQEEVSDSSHQDHNANTTPDATCNKFRKHSSGDLHSRLKTRKLLGVGETDDGDVHRSKLSQILGHSDQLYIHLPSGLRVWLIVLSLLISILAVWALLFPSHYFSTMYDVDGSTFTFPVRLYACALISISVMYWNTVQASDRDVIRMILLSSVVFFALQTCVLLSCWLPWLPASRPDSVLCSVVMALIARLVVIAISSYFYWITHKDGKSKDVKYFR